MRYVGKFKDIEVSLEFETEGNRIYLIEDGEKLELSFKKISPYTYLLFIGNKAYRILYDGKAFYIEGTGYEVEVLEESYKKVMQFIKSAEAKDLKEIEIRAVMPGNIVGIKKNVGEEVEEGECVVILEAMKMENEIMSPRKGIVERILVKEGDKVSQNQVLAIIKPL